MAAAHKPVAALVVALAATALVVVLLQQESANQQFTVLEEVDPDEPFNIEAAITGIKPRNGPFRGGNEVTITGQALLAGGPGDVRQVLVGGTPVERVIAASPNEIRFVMGHRSPRVHNPGPADVAIVSRIKGQVVAQGLYHFNEPPRVLEVRPDNGPHSGGNEVAIEGRHLTAGSDDQVTVLIDGQECKVVQQSKHHVRVIAAAHEHHSRRHKAHVVVRSVAYGEAKLRRSYTYNPAPEITHISPAEGPNGGGNKLRIHGDMLTAGQGRTHEKVSVTIGGKPAPVLSFSPNTVLVEAPGHTEPGLVAIEVSSSRHGLSKMDMAYKYHSQPVIEDIEPSSGQADGGDHITLRGRHLGKGDVDHVYFGSRRARVLHSSSDGKEVLVQTKRFAEGDEGKHLRVKLESATFGTTVAEDHFHVGKRGKIMSVSPRDGPCEGGTALTIRGTNLSQNSKVETALVATVAGSAAKVLRQSDKEVVVQTGRCAAGNTQGVISLLSTSVGHIKTPYSLKFQYNALAVVHHLSPENGPHAGGGDVLLRGQRLCHEACDDLESVRIGNAVITDFKSKSPRRVVFTAPSAQEAGGVGEHTVVVHSTRYGRTAVPRGFSINAETAPGTVHPSNLPSAGGSRVTIQAPDLGMLGSATEVGVDLAGVPGTVLTATPTELILLAGDASKHPAWTSDGLAGPVVVTANINGKSYAKDLGLHFRYNPPCSISAVSVQPGAHGGELSVLVSGSHLGLGDEQVIVDGTPATIHRRERHSDNVYRHHGTVAHEGKDISLVEVNSRRTGTCRWQKDTAAGKPAKAAPAAATDPNDKY